MIAGVTKAPTNVAAVVSDRVLVGRIAVPDSRLMVRLDVYSDGAGGVDAQTLRGVIYDAVTGALLMTGTPVVMPAAAPAGWLALPMPPSVLRATDVWAGLHAGPGSALRVYSEALAGPAVGRRVTDTYSDGPAASLAAGTDVGRPGVFATLATPWVPPLISDEDLAALGWQSSQQALRGSGNSGTAQTVGVEWHGTLLDDREGAFAIVRQGGPLEQLVGERLRVALSDREVFVVIVGSSDELDEDVSLARRAWLALANLSEDRADVLVEVVTGALTG